VFQRRAVAAMVCALGISLLAGCGFESPAVTFTEHNSVQGTNYLVGQIFVASAFVTPNPTAPATTMNVVVTFVNNGPRADVLTGAASPQGPVILPGGAITLPPGVVVQVVDPNLSSTGNTMLVRPTGSLPVAGQYLALSFHFADAGPSNLKSVPVVPQGESEGIYTTLPNGVATPPPPDLPYPVSS
jgi:hypothetical protein